MEVPEFSPDGPDLIYVAIADHITARIAAGQLRPNEQLPPERELAAEYGHAYMTVRRAMKELRGRGLVVSVLGRGTFITKDAPERARARTWEQDGPDQD